jgi:hypothetical protein
MANKLVVKSLVGGVWHNWIPGGSAPIPAPTGGGGGPPPNGDVLLGYWDELRGSGNQGANSGVDIAMANALGDPRPISQFMRGYTAQSQPSSWTGNPVEQSASYQNCGMVNFGCGSDYTGYMNGNYDAATTNFYNSVPTSIKLYTTFQHEPENDSGINPTVWAQAVGRYINFVAPIYRARGLQGGVGGLLMGTTMTTEAISNTWNWWKYVLPINLPQTVFMLDDYAKFLTPTTTEDLIPGWIRQFGYARDEGVTRFGIGETGISIEKRNAGGQIIGDNAGQEAWIRKEVPLFRAIDGLEFVTYFHKPTGPASKNDELNGSALLAWAQASRGDF